MDSARYGRLHEVFEGARALEGPEREAYLAQACSSDTALLSEVRELLQEDALPVAPLQESGVAMRRAHWEKLQVGESEDEPQPDGIDGYRILRRLGSGGMGVVYVAEQQEPRRRVALKVLHPTHAFGRRLRRFRREAELLGRLRHPGIAQVHTSGTLHASGGLAGAEQPYFAMELVEGTPLTEYASRRNLGIREKLGLMAQVCDAVQHAHDKGIVHRDLKPDNVLVDEEGRPKVLDFGIAQASEQDPSLSTLHTGEGEVLGTLTHMAPEQLSGDPSAVGPLVDVWGLGVLLYEILSGCLPYNLAGLTLPAAARTLETQAPRLLGSFDVSLRGDVETIVAKAVDQEPQRRYVSPAALAADLRRFLERRPISARPASRAYRASRFARRNPVLVAGVTSTLLAILAGIIAAAIYARRAGEGREMALQRGAQVKSALYGATLRMLASDPWRARLELEQVAEADRDWAWRWLARQTPLLLEPLGPQPDRTFYSTLAEFANERQLLDILQDSNGIFRPAAIDLADPTRADFLAGDLGTLPIHSRVVGRRLHMIRPPNDWVTLDSANGQSIVRETDDEALFARYGPDGLALGSTPWDSPSGEAMVVTRVGADGDRTREALLMDLNHFFELSLDGRYVYHSRWHEVQLFSSEPLEPLGTVSGHGSLAGVAFSPGADSMAIASEALGLQVYSVPDLEEQRRFKLPSSKVFAVDWPPPGDRIAVSVEGGAVVVDASSGNILADLSYPWGDYHVAHRLDLSPDGRLLSLFAANEFRPWVVELDAKTDPASTSIPLSDWTYGVAVSPDGDLLARLTPKDPIISIHDAWNGDLVAAFTSREASESYDAGGWLAFSSDGLTLVYTALHGSDRMSVRSIDLTTGAQQDGPLREREQLWTLPSALSDDFAEAVGDRAPDMHPRITFAADSGQMVAGHQGLPDVVDYGAVKQLPKTPFNERANYKRWEIFGVEASQGADWLAMGTEHALRILNATGTNLLRELPSPDATFLYALKESPDGRLLACGSASGRITVYETRFWNRLLSIDAHEDYVYDLAWSPDGTRLFSASGDASLKIWDAVHPVARRFQAEDREARFDVARAQLAERTAALGDPERAAQELLDQAESVEARRAARRAALEAWGGPDR